MLSFVLIVAETVREQDWDGIVTCHQGCPYARTWSYKNKVIVAAETKPPLFILYGWRYIKVVLSESVLLCT